MVLYLYRGWQRKRSCALRSWASSTRCPVGCCTCVCVCICVCVCVCVCIHTRTRAHTHTHTHTHTFTRTHTQTHTHAHMHTHTLTHTHMHTFTHIPTHKLPHALSLSDIRTLALSLAQTTPHMYILYICIRYQSGNYHMCPVSIITCSLTRTHMHMRAHTRIHTHTHTRTDLHDSDEFARCYDEARVDGVALPEAQATHLFLARDQCNEGHTEANRIGDLCGTQSIQVAVGGVRLPMNAY